MEKYYFYCKSTWKTITVLVSLASGWESPPSVLGPRETHPFSQQCTDTTRSYLKLTFFLSVRFQISSGNLFPCPEGSWWKGVGNRQSSSNPRHVNTSPTSHCLATSTPATFRVFLCWTLFMNDQTFRDLWQKCSNIKSFKVLSTLVHCCTLSLCYLGAETDDHHRNPNINTEII